MQNAGYAKYETRKRLTFLKRLIQEHWGECERQEEIVAIMVKAMSSYKMPFGEPKTADWCDLLISLWNENRILSNRIAKATEHLQMYARESHFYETVMKDLAKLPLAKATIKEDKEWERKKQEDHQRYLDS